MNKMVKAIKKIHAKDICLFKIGTFYHSYGRDAYILSYLFEYKLKDEEEDVKSCGFPVNSIAKVTAKLENKKINYIIIDRRNNYDIDQKSDNRNLNTYDEIYEKARRHINRVRRIENITDFLMSNIDNNNINQVISKMEEIINERRKI